MEYNRHMARDQVEVEVKHSVPVGAALPSFDDLPGVATVDPPVTQQLVADYFDTDDLRLARLGITVADAFIGCWEVIPRGKLCWRSRSVGDSILMSHVEGLAGLRF